LLRSAGVAFGTRVIRELTKCLTDPLCPALSAMVMAMAMAMTVWYAMMAKVFGWVSRASLRIVPVHLGGYHSTQSFLHIHSWA
jgi:hypothetical protein